MKVLVTRPVERAPATIKALASHCIIAVCEPMLVLRPVSAAAIRPRQFQALLITSMGAAEILGSTVSDRSVTIYAVGDATAHTVRERGFYNVRSAGGDVSNLFDLVKQSSDPLGGPLLHVGSDEVAGDLVDRLRVHGFCAERVVIYQMQEAVRFSEHTLVAFQKKEIEAVLFFSPRSARTFEKLFSLQQRPIILDDVSVFCLSRAIAQEINQIGWSEVVVCQKPTMTSLISSVVAFFPSLVQEQNAER